MGPTGLLNGRGASMPSRAGQSALRESNLGLVVRTVLAAPDEARMSRAAVAAATTMTRSTVSRLVDDLVSAGVLDELDPPAGVGPGRPAKPLVPGAAIAALGIQANTSYLAATVLDLRGRVVAKGIRYGSFVGCEPGPTLAELGRLCRGVLAEVPAGVRVIGSGFALPGIVTTATGELMLAPNLGWSEIDVSSHLRLDGNPASGGAELSLRVGNEADLAAVSVAQPAPGRHGPLRDFIYLSGEIGIGGALVMDGKVMSGRHGWAGEVGHVCVDPNGPTCPCGSTGCLERYAGRKALLDGAGMSQGAAPEDLAQRARSGDPAAAAAVSRAAWALGVALAGVVNVVDIQDVVLGGHLALVADELRPELESILGTRVLSARWAGPRIHTVGSDVAPGATGAALVELAEVVNDPARFIDPG